MSIIGCALLALFLATLPGRAQEEAVEEREAFLREAEIVGRETIDTGITRPQRLELLKDGVSRRAVFKGFEIEFPRRVTTVGRERQRGLRDSWRFEVAAYELDRLLGLHLVPIAVVREVDGHEGALIDWVDDVLPEFETTPFAFSLTDWQEQVETVWFFDYLAYNIDRTPENLLITEGFKVRLIDHSRAFQEFVVPMRPLTRFPKAAIDRLRRLDEDDFRKALGRYLNGDEMKALVERRRRILAHVDQLLSQRPSEEVFF